MHYTIEYQETITRTNSVTIEIESEAAGDQIAESLYENAGDFNHPDDIFSALDDMDAKVVSTCKGAEECTYEIC